MTGPGDYAPFRGREIRFHDVRDLGGYRLKLYSVRHGHEPLDLLERFAGAWPLVDAALPRPAVDGPRPGVGFVIELYVATVLGGPAGGGLDAYVGARIPASA